MHELYREIILEEYKYPQNKGKINGAVSHHELNPLCGDEITVYLVIDNGTIADISWEGQGCAISLASASLFTEHIKGKTVKEVEAMNEKVILDLIGITPNPMRMKCAILIMKTTANTLVKT